MAQPRDFRSFASEGNSLLRTGSAGGGRAHFSSIDADTKMSEVGLTRDSTFNL